MPDDALIVSELESWLKLETRDAIHVHGDQMEPRRGHLHGQLLPAAAVASGKERRLPARFRQVVDGGDSERLGAVDWS